jgi:GLPGLI family protein
MNKYPIFLLIALLVHSVICGQSLEAHYTVTTNFEIPLKDGAVKKGSVDLAGTLYRKQNRYIYFERPLYLEKYPDGSISVNISPTEASAYVVSTDTLQSINYSDYDSLTNRYRVDYKVDVRNNVRHFDRNFYSWTFLPEKKDINGLHCQKASLTMNGNPQWTVWFCPDIQMDANPGNIKSLPGLVVEADNIPLKKHYTLDTYSANTNIADKNFWPNEFNEKFQEGAPLVKTGDQKINKTQKQAELLKQ